MIWEPLFDPYGAKGLRATRIKQYRRTRHFVHNYSSAPPPLDG
ncbi:MAG: hypothetical protein JKY17_07790 [Magnetovibrio sp.]|nr:hypothetical protein [Magnetovibrio sp.]